MYRTIFFFVTPAVFQCKKTTIINFFSFEVVYNFIDFAVRLASESVHLERRVVFDVVFVL